MVLFLTITLYVSIAGLVALLLLKRFELRSGKTLLMSVRPRMNIFFHDALFFVEYVLPSVLRRLARSAWGTVRTQAKLALARLMFAFEHGLENMLHLVREKTEVHRQGGQASAFLREVAEHKKSLLKRAKKERVIVDE